MSIHTSQVTFSKSKKLPTVATVAVASILFCSQMAPVLAADLQIYGRAHLSTDVLGDGSDYGLNVSSNSSRLGIRAKHQVHDNIEVFMQLEQNVRFDQRGGDFATRDSFAGLRGDWGQVRVGSFDTPGKLLRAKADVFNDRLGDLRNIASGGGMSFDPRFRNSIHYRSPVFNNTTFDIQYSPHNATDATTDNELQAVSVALNYQYQRVWLGVAYEQTEGSQNDPSALRLAGSYNFTDALQGIAFYQHASDLQFGERDAFGGGAKYRFGDYAVMGQV
ncbi:MAG: porin, partial [Idiomarina sp.]|nr:porin [Idiomarina sp.]